MLLQEAERSRSEVEQVRRSLEARTAELDSLRRDLAKKAEELNQIRKVHFHFFFSPTIFRSLLNLLVVGGGKGKGGVEIARGVRPQRCLSRRGEAEGPSLSPLHRRHFLYFVVFLGSFHSR